MAGGLIELTSYGTQDLYLTGTPQITFFKAVYRRYTNFSVETVIQRFSQDNLDFGNTLTCTLEKNGDLLHKMYFAAELPSVQLAVPTINTNNNPTIEELNFNTADSEYTAVDNFSTYNITLYRTVLPFLQPTNPNSLTQATLSIVDLVSTLDPSGSIANNFKQVILKYANNSVAPADVLYTNTFVPLILTTLSAYVLTVDPTTINLVTLFNQAIQSTINIHQEFFCRRQTALQSQLLATDTLTQGAIRQYAKFAWVKRIGHMIFEYIEIEMGGQRIDRQYSDWINIWWELEHSTFQEENYMKMIGNVCELTTFSPCQKPSYLLTTPLQFWFCKFAGLALPLVSLSFYDVVFNVKLRNLTSCCFTDSNGIDLLDTIHLLDTYFLVDYIYLDGDERRRFAQVTHEYLIEQVQRIEFRTFSKDTNNFQVEFVNPCKEMVWVYQRDDFTVNDSGTNECQFYNYTLNLSTEQPPCNCCKTNFTQCQFSNCVCLSLLPQYLPTNSVGNPVVITTPFNYTNPATSTTQYTPGNPISTSTLFMQGYQMGGNTLPNFEGNLTNYLFPWQFNTHTPADGVNIYSFATNPEQHQPSGSCNMGKIGSVNLVVQFVPDIQNSDINGTFVIYAITYNILRCMAGMAGVAFTFASNA
jgi:hypothetical protein